MAVVLEVPFGYTARVVKRYCRDDQSRAETFVGWTPVRVAEIAAQAARVALRAVMPDGSALEYREFGGGLVRPLALRVGGRDVQVGAGNAQDLMRRWYDELKFSPTVWPFLPERFETIGWPMRDGEAVRRTLSTDREERLRAVREGFEHGSAFVDGQLFVPSRGPAWVLACDGGPRVELRPEFGHAVGDPRTWRERVFPWDGRAQAEAALRAAAAAAPDGHGAPPRVLGAVSGAADPSAGLAAELAAAAEALLGVVSPGLASMAPEAIRAFADVKAALAAGICEDSAEGALMALRELHDHWLSAGNAGKSGRDPVAGLVARLGRSAAAADLGALTPEAAAALR